MRINARANSRKAATGRSSRVNTLSLRTALLATVLAALLVVHLPAVPATPPDRDGPENCAGGRHERGLGDVCPRSNGLLEVFHPGNHRSVGFTHGLDPAPSGDDPSTPAAPLPPHCVSGAAGTYHIKVFYARASNDVDNYASTVATIRSLVDQANGFVNDAAVATGGAASLNVKCTSGVVDVINAVLPTAMASASFSTIVTDLNNMGYTDGKVKHWVYYDDTGACGCGGTGNVYNDDSLAVSNLNNGNGGALFAVNFGYNSAHIMMHELGHNLGAVQKSAPHSTDPGGSHPNGWHCWDGLDTMCYDDGAPNGYLYSTGYCSVEVFDCGKDDYFHVSPSGGSYLASHWNLGNSMNRYLDFGSTVTIRDDDDEQDTFFDFDYVDDVARKRLVLPTNALAGATSATFYIRALSLECGAVGNNHRLRANGVTVLDYNPCSIWSTAVFEWKTFNVPLSSLTAGATNTFDVIEIAGDWTDRNVHFAMDSDHDYGRTDASANGVNVNGELMWYLVIKGPGCSGGPSNNCFVNRQPIAFPGTVLLAQSTVGATIEAGEPASTCSSMARTVWFQYTPTLSGLLVVTTLLSSFNTNVAVYTGSSVQTLSQVGCNNDIVSPTIPQSLVLVVPVTAGVPYQIQVGGASGASGTLDLTVVGT